MDDNSKIMELAYEAGAILLENGAEISRVDETMRRIAGNSTGGLRATLLCGVMYKNRIGKWLAKRRK